MKNTSTSLHEAVALRRLSLVQQIIELIQQHWPLSAALEQVASASSPARGRRRSPQFVAQRTLEDWYYAFKKGGFEGLKPKLRCDRGKPRRLSAAQQQWILNGFVLLGSAGQTALSPVETSRCHPASSLGAIYRWLEQNDLDAQGRRYLLRQNIPGPTKAF
ncbi:MAG: helix-turn-helix domain-containing protein [Verrucomicrobiota bacterium]